MFPSQKLFLYNTEQALISWTTSGVQVSTANVACWRYRRTHGMFQYPLLHVPLNGEDEL